MSRIYYLSLLIFTAYISAVINIRHGRESQLPQSRPPGVSDILPVAVPTSEALAVLAALAVPATLAVAAAAAVVAGSGGSGGGDGSGDGVCG